MYAPDFVARCLEMIAEGASTARVASVMGVCESTVTRWRTGRVPHRARLVMDGEDLCPACGMTRATHRDLPEGRYAYTLGLYLGDGCITPARNTWNFRVYMDAAYPSVIEEARSSLAGISPTGHAGVYQKRGTNYVVVNSYAQRWRCLFPQHGPGKKHERSIVLEAWQREIVRNYPGPFLRALIHTDGWRGENRVHVKGKDYSYPRYQFSSRSEDIRRMFTDACDLLEIDWRPWGRWHVSVARKDAVAALDEHVGLKT